MVDGNMIQIVLLLKKSRLWDIAWISVCYWIIQQRNISHHPIKSIKKCHLKN
ncbi:hypothetical protein pb186bvf_012012 [Paramecium bursaria]